MTAYLPEAIWPTWKRLLFKVCFLYVLLFAVSFSFPHTVIPDVGYYTNSFFEKASHWFGQNVLGLGQYTTQLVSDSTGFYVNALFLLVVSVVLATGWSVADKKRSNHTLLFRCFWVGVRYYLALQLLVYGFNKLFKWQFYLPEPNTLYTPLGQLSPDILYWSAMGVSRTFSLITGGIEVVAAVLLLLRKTVLAGVLLSIVALLNIFIINISFDVSVKLYSLFLLLLCCVVLSPYAKGLLHFLTQQDYKPVRISFPVSSTYKKMYAVLKSLVIVLIFFDALAVYVKTGNFNDDAAARPPLHGAYDVVTFAKGGDTLAPLLTDTVRWSRVFIHRRNYFIAQYMNDAMQDYELETDTAAKTIWISSPEDSVAYALRYTVSSDSILHLQGLLKKEEIFLKLKKLDLKSLPALNGSFHWTIDE